RAARVSAQLWRLGREVSIQSTSLGWDGHVLSVTGPGFVHRDLRLPLVGDYQPANAALAVAAAHLLDAVTDDQVRAGLASTRWPGRPKATAEHPRVILDGGHNSAAMVKAGAALRRLIGQERLVAVFAMLSERDPVQLLAALRTLKPEAVVFTEPASAQGHVIVPERLAASTAQAPWWRGRPAKPSSGPGSWPVRRATSLSAGRSTWWERSWRSGTSPQEAHAQVDAGRDQGQQQQQHEKKPPNSTHDRQAALGGE